MVFLLFANKIITISKAVANLIIQSKIAPLKKVQVIHYGFEFKEVKKDTGTFRYELHQAIIVGRLIPVKQHKIIIEIMIYTIYIIVIINNIDIKHWI